MLMVDIQNLEASYGRDFTLKNINLSIVPGTVFSLLGPNGAGKTTLVKTMLNFMPKNSGQVTINGIDSSHKESRARIAFIPEKFTFFSHYTAQGVLEFYGKMKGLQGRELTESVENALVELNIGELKNRKLSKMSKGQVQRVGLATILIGQNDLIVLDEPFSGLDPIGIKDLKDILKKLKNLGKTFFINSHILSEMEQVCDQVAILNKGELLFSGTVDSILSSGKTLESFFYETIQDSTRI